MFFEDNTFEIMELENDILYESIHLDILKSSIMEDIYIEQGESSSKFKTFVNNIIEKIKTFFINAKEAIINFFKKKKINDRLDEIEKSIKENSELGKQQIVIPDYDKIVKLYEETISDLKNKNEDTNKIAEKYKTQRNKIMKTGIVTTVSLAAGIGLVKGLDTIATHRLEKQKNAVLEQCKRYKNEINDLENEIDGLENEIYDKNMDIKKKAEQIDNQQTVIRKQSNKIKELSTSSPIKKIGYRITGALDDSIDKRKDNRIKIAKKKDQLALCANVACDIAKDTGTIVKNTFDAVVANPFHPISAGISAYNKDMTKTKKKYESSDNVWKKAENNQKRKNDKKIDELLDRYDQLKDALKSNHSQILKINGKNIKRNTVVDMLSSIKQQLETLGEHPSVSRGFSISSSTNKNLINTTIS